MSANKPIFHLVAGSMVQGDHEGARVGACTDCRSDWGKFWPGTIDDEEIAAVREQLTLTAGRCGVIETASTMACKIVALDSIPFNGASASAVSTARLRIAEATGNLAVTASSRPGLRLQELLTRKTILNAILVCKSLEALPTQYLT